MHRISPSYAEPWQRPHSIANLCLQHLARAALTAYYQASGCNLKTGGCAIRLSVLRLAPLSLFSILVVPILLGCMATKTCSPTEVLVGTSTSCTITLTGPTKSTGPQSATMGDVIMDTVTSPAGAKVVACLDATGGLSCGTPSGNSVSVTCVAAVCPNDASHFNVRITSPSPGPLVEDLQFDGEPVTFTPPQVMFYLSGPQAAPVETAPTKTCSPTTPLLGASTVCTLTLTSPLGPASALTDTLTSPAGAAISACGASGGLVCQPSAPNLPSATVVCPGPSPCPAGATAVLTIFSNTAGSLGETVAIMPSGYLPQSFSVTPDPAVSFAGSAPAPTQNCNGVQLPLSSLCLSPVQTPVGPQPLPALIPIPAGA